jgi:exonuclease SbcC
MRNYQSQYLASCKLFRETADGNNIEIATEISEGRYSFPLLERALLGSRIKFQDQISEELRTANRSRHKLIDSIHETMLKIFIRTKTKYEEYRTQVRDLNLFFKGKTISNKYFFQVEFIPSGDIPIEWINQLQSQSQHLYKPGELPIGESVDVFVEDFFKTAVGYKKKIAFRDLLDPKTYFTLDAGLTDENGKEVSGSTGETYTAKVLLGIGRLSKVQSQNRDGIRFIILEETANLDKTNFNNFPAIAKEFGYQIITMTPKPFGADAAAGWYLHHLLPGRNDPDINYPMPASYFKTNTDKENLLTYLNKKAQ